jgi:cyclophilin family peptidyl-prolyl cis-trans isomerase
VTRALAPLVVVLALAGCGGGSDDEAAAPTAGSGTCQAVDAPDAREDGGATKPTEPLAAEATYRLVFSTNCGDFTVTLDQKTAPETSASLVALARAGFYDGTIIHRIVPGFVIQGGDPTGTGTGGPGYQTIDVPPTDARYTHGVVAMAKSGADPPGTAGSQFFVVTGADVGLPAEYAIVGEVTDGLEVVDAIGELGDPATEQPTEPVVVASVTVSEG